MLCNKNPRADAMIVKIAQNYLCALVETKTKKPAGFFNFVDFGANTQIQCVSEHVQFKIHL